MPSALWAARGLLPGMPAEQPALGAAFHGRGHAKQATSATTAAIAQHAKERCPVEADGSAHVSVDAAQHERLADSQQAHAEHNDTQQCLQHLYKRVDHTDNCKQSFRDCSACSTHASTGNRTISSFMLQPLPRMCCLPALFLAAVPLFSPVPAAGAKMTWECPTISLCWLPCASKSTLQTVQALL